MGYTKKTCALVTSIFIIFVSNSNYKLNTVLGTRIVAKIDGNLSTKPKLFFKLNKIVEGKLELDFTGIVRVCVD